MRAWTKGVLLSYYQFAQLWLHKMKKTDPHPEWAYLRDLKKGLDMTDWKLRRAEKAQDALTILGVSV